jgi:heme-degrading monooxygenase HmoA
MHARIATVRTVPGAARRIETTWRDLLSRYEESDAFLGMISLYEPDADTAVTLTLWTSDAAADRAASRLRDLAVEAFAGLLLEAPRITRYDALLTHLRTPPPAS